MIQEPLYRFRSTKALFSEDGGFGELEKQSIYFPGPDQLNDGYEGALSLLAPADEHTWSQLLLDFASFLKRKSKELPYDEYHLKELAARLSSKMSDAYRGEDALFCILQGVLNGNLHKVDTRLHINRSALAQDRIKSNAISKTLSEEFIEEIKGKIHPNWGVACFTGSAGITNASNWGAYCDAGKGAALMFSPCLEYRHHDLSMKSKEPFIVLTGKHSSRKGKRDSVYFLTFTKVSYLIKRENIPLDHLYRPSFTSASKDAYKKNQKEYYEAFFKNKSSKMKDWEHEDEFRLIIEENFCQCGFEKSERTLTYSFYALEGIVFGYNMSRTDKEKIINIILKKCTENQRTSFVFKQAFYNYDSGKIDAIELDIEIPET